MTTVIILLGLGIPDDQWIQIIADQNYKWLSKFGALQGVLCFLGCLGIQIDFPMLKNAVALNGSKPYKQFIDFSD